MSAAVRLGAYINLGLHVLRTVVRRAGTHGGDGLRAFERNYVAEGHRPLDPDERNLAVALGRCFACRRCDAESRSIGATYPGPMALVLGASRDPVLDTLSAEAARAFGAENHLTLEHVCPARIPFRHLAARIASG